jgi:hypothetical protein
MALWINFIEKWFFYGITYLLKSELKPAGIIKWLKEDRQVGIETRWRLPKLRDWERQIFEDKVIFFKNSKM